MASHSPTPRPAASARSPCHTGGECARHPADAVATAGLLAHLPHRQDPGATSLAPRECRAVTTRYRPEAPRALAETQLSRAGRIGRRRQARRDGLALAPSMPPASA